MSEVIPDKPKRKAMFLSPTALSHLKATSSRRRTERAAVEEALALLAKRDEQLDAMAAFVAEAQAAWGSPSRDDRAEADRIWSNR